MQMPEEFTYIKIDPYAHYKVNIPVAQHNYKEALFAGNPDSIQFTITPLVGQRLITIGLQTFHLIGNISPNSPMVVALTGPEAIPPIQRSESNTSKIEFIHENKSYTCSRKDSHGLLSLNSNEIARITPAWKDSDDAKRIKFWIRSLEPIPALVAALFFCLTQTQEVSTEYGMAVSY